ncbi:hypothetical protein CMV_027736 [Castanea mollissima]|uniref:Uncharacterized protein n=1 Tax=Castanea mollissima TaxID=60419 RepID=A0A8J4VEU2_9ROSI|nr:hypothetical protein CMV_027736 [Castanea mollissima]
MLMPGISVFVEVKIDIRMSRSRITSADVHEVNVADLYNCLHGKPVLHARLLQTRRGGATNVLETDIAYPKNS